MDSEKIGSPSMRLRPDLERWKVVHEFGHALGFIHEMRHQDWAECRKEFSVDRFVSSGQWGNEQQTLSLIKRAMDKPFFEDQGIERTDTFDSESVMTYRIEADYFNSGNEHCALNPSPSPTESDIFEFLDVYRLP